MRAARVGFLSAANVFALTGIGERAPVRGDCYERHRTGNRGCGGKWWSARPGPEQTLF